MSNFFILIMIATFAFGHCKRKLTSDYWAKELGMVDHFEGGKYTETYKSKESCLQLPGRYGENATRTFGTHIYYMLREKEISVLHRLRTDEIWHHYYGSTVSLHIIDSNTGNLTVHQLGRAGRKFVAVVKAGDWFGAKLRSRQKGNYAVLGATVSPGFENSDYEEASRKKLIAKFRQHKRIIKLLTKDESLTNA